MYKHLKGEEDQKIVLIASLSPTGYHKRTGQFLRALHVYSIDNLSTFDLNLNDLKRLQMSLCVSNKSSEVILSHLRSF